MPEPLLDEPEQLTCSGAEHILLTTTLYCFLDEVLEEKL